MRKSSHLSDSTSLLSSFRIRMPGVRDYGVIECVGMDSIYFRTDRLYWFSYYASLDKISVENDPTGEKKIELFKIIDDCRMTLHTKKQKAILASLISHFSIQLPNQSGYGRIAGINGQTISFSFDKTYSGPLMEVVNKIQIKDDLTGENKALLLHLINDFQIAQVIPQKKSEDEMARMMREISSFKIRVPDSENIRKITTVKPRELRFFKPVMDEDAYSLYSVIDKITVEGDTTGEKKEQLLRLIDEYRRPLFLTKNANKNTNQINSRSVSIQMIVFGVLLVAFQIIAVVSKHYFGENGSYYPEPVIPLFKVLSNLTFYLPGIVGIFGLVTGIKSLHNDFGLFAKAVFCVVAFFTEAFIIEIITTIFYEIWDTLPKTQIAYDIYSLVIRFLYLLVPLLCAATGSFGGSIAASLGRTYIRIASAGIRLFDPEIAGLTLCNAIPELAFTACAAIFFCVEQRSQWSFKSMLIKLITCVLNGFLLEVLVRITICPIILQYMAPKYAEYLGIHFDRLDIYSLLIFVGIPVIAITIDTIMIIRNAKRRKVGDTKEWPMKTANSLNEGNNQPIIRFCRKCGHELSVGSKFCNFCGTEVKDINVE